MSESAAWQLVRGDRGEAFVIDGDKIVGRSERSDVRIQDGYLSRRHARLWLEGDMLRLEDLGSANGTFVNGDRISVPLTLAEGDTVRFDAIEFTVQAPVPPAPPEPATPSDPDRTELRPSDAPTPSIAPPSPPSPPSPPPAPALKPTTPPKPATPPTPRPTPAPAPSPAAASRPAAPPVGAAASPSASSAGAASAKSDSLAATVVTDTGEFEIDGQKGSTQDVDLNFDFADTKPDTPATPAAASETSTGASADDGYDKTQAVSGLNEMPALLGLEGPVAGHLYHLLEGRVTLGRGRECDIPLEESSVSKRHAEIQVSGTTCRVISLAAANGVFVNGTRLDQAELQPGDVLRLGRVELMFDTYERLSDAMDEPSGMPAWVWAVIGFVVTATVAGALAFAMLSR